MNTLATPYKAQAMQTVSVVGAGIAGMCSALALSRARFDVTLFERDVPPPEGDADEAFFAWQRRGAAQFRHPHAFLGLMCSILEEHYPDLLEDFFATGARKVPFADMVPPRLLPKYTPEPGDEKLWMLMCRRATMETVLRRYVARQSSITVNDKTYVTGMQVAPVANATRSGDTGDELDAAQPNLLTVTGLELTDRANGNARSTHQADVYVDATGRSSKFPRWLADAGVSVAEQRDDAEIVYYTRHYRLNAGVSEPSRHDHEPFAGDLGYMKYGVFPGENGHFAIIVCLPNDEIELRETIKNGAHFDAVCKQIPGLQPWVGEDHSTATTDSFGIGEIHAVWRDFLTTSEQPQLLNFFAVGDACVRTNPLYGRGCSTGILHAHILAETLAAQADPTLRAVKYEHETHARLRPIFDASLSEDKNGIKRAAATKLGEDREESNNLKKWFGLAFRDALAAAIQDEIHVFRGMMRTVNLVEKPGDFLKDGKVKRTVFRYMLRGRKRNARERNQRGPSRSEMLDYIKGL